VASLIGGAFEASRRASAIDPSGACSQARRPNVECEVLGNWPDPLR